MMKKIGFVLVAMFILTAFISCQKEKEIHPLQVKLQEYIDTCPAKIGVAVILPDSDTIVVNDGHYTMTSIITLFQDLPSAYALKRRGMDITDSVWVHTNDLDKTFYSPMLDDIEGSYVPFSWRSIFENAVSKRDLNASNLLFMHLAPIDSVKAFWNNKGIEDFDIKYKDVDIHHDYSKVTENWTSPLAAARVISYTAPLSMISSNYTLATAGGVLMTCLPNSDNCIVKPLNATNAQVFHRTGWARNDSNGNPISVSDVAYILLPSGQAYTLAVFVDDSQVDRDQTEAMVAHISEMVLQYIFEQADLKTQAKETT